MVWKRSGFRDQLIAAPLKHHKPAIALTLKIAFPRSIDRGSLSLFENVADLGFHFHPQGLELPVGISCRPARERFWISCHGFTGMAGGRRCSCQGRVSFEMVL